MNFEEFILNEERIYAKFRDVSILEKEGIIQKIPEQHGGYSITYRHPSRITDKLSQFSEQVARIVPTIAYTEKNAHTTLSELGSPQDNFSPDSETLNKLCSIVHANLPLSNKVLINYREWLLNQNSGISAGVPNESFLENSKRVVDYANRQGIMLKLPWGAHITTNRFLENRSPEEIKEVLNYFKNSAPPGESKPEFVDVGYFTLSRAGFEYHTQERFKL